MYIDFFVCQISFTRIFPFFYSLTLKINFHFPARIFPSLIIWVAMIKFKKKIQSDDLISAKNLFAIGMSENKLMTKLMYDKIFNSNNVIKTNFKWVKFCLKETKWLGKKAKIYKVERCILSKVYKETTILIIFNVHLIHYDILIKKKAIPYNSISKKKTGSNQIIYTKALNGVSMLSLI